MPARSSHGRRGPRGSTVRSLIRPAIGLRTTSQALGRNTITPAAQRGDPEAVGQVGQQHQPRHRAERPGRDRPRAVADPDAAAAAARSHAWPQATDEMPAVAARDARGGRSRGGWWSQPSAGERARRPGAVAPSRVGPDRGGRRGGLLGRRPRGRDLGGGGRRLRGRLLGRRRLPRSAGRGRLLGGRLRGAAFLGAAFLVAAFLAAGLVAPGFVGAGFRADFFAAGFAAALLAGLAGGAAGVAAPTTPAPTRRAPPGAGAARARPVSMPRWPPGTISKRTSREPVSSGRTARTDGTGAIPSVAPAKTSTGAARFARSMVRSPSRKAPPARALPLTNRW